MTKLTDKLRDPRVVANGRLRTEAANEIDRLMLENEQLQKELTTLTRQ